MSAAAHPRILELALVGLLRRRARLLGVVAVYALLVALCASLLLFVEGVRGQTRALLAGGPDLVVERLGGARTEPLAPARADAIREIAGVRAVEPRVWGSLHDDASGATVTIWGTDVLREGALHLEEGWAPSPGGGECLIGGGLAAARGVEVGERLPLRGADGAPFAPRVAGVLSRASDAVASDVVVLTPGDARRILALAPGDATDLAVYLDDPAAAATVARRIQERWADGRTVTRAQLLATHDAALDWRSGVWASVLLLVVAAFAVLVWDAAAGTSSEELRTLGMLRAVGWTSGEVMALRAWQGALVSLAACAAGALLAAIHLVAFDGALVAGAVQGGVIPVPTLPIAPRLDAHALLVGLALTVLPYTAASLIPAWRAAVTDPGTALRG